MEENWVEFFFNYSTVVLHACVCEREPETRQYEKKWFLQRVQEKEKRLGFRSESGKEILVTITSKNVRQ